MQFRGILIAAVLLGALGGGLYWSNRAKKAEESKPSDTSTKIVSLPEDSVQQIEIRRKDAGTTVVRKTDAGNWQLTAPQKLPVDQESVTTLLSTASSLSADAVVEEKPADYAQFGLTQPEMEVVLTTKDGKTEKVLVGEETPTQGGFFAKREGDPRVFTIASYNKSSLDKDVKDLRDKRLLTFDSDKLSRVELTAKKQTVEFGRNNQNEWQILRPNPYRADGWAVEELVRKLKDAKMDLTIADEEAKKATKSFGAGTPVAVARVTDASSTQQIEVRKGKDNNYYARSSAVEGVHKVSTELGEGLDKSLDDFRNKKLFDFGFNEPRKVEFREDAKSLVFEKSDEKWMSAGKQMDSTGVQAFIDHLRDLSATKFVNQGFTTPAIEITVTSNDGKRVEKVQISKSGNAYIAKRENEPALYEVEAKAVEELQKAAADVKEAPPKK